MSDLIFLHNQFSHHLKNQSLASTESRQPQENDALIKMFIFHDNNIKHFVLLR